MTTTNKTPSDQAATEDQAGAEEPKGRLVLATGSVVHVPADGLQVSTEHYDPKFKVTVPVVSTFVVN